MGRGSGVNKGMTIHLNHIVTPCGKTYDGVQRAADMYVSLHKKTCLVCKNAEVDTDVIKIKTHVKMRLSGKQALAHMSRKEDKCARRQSERQASA